MNQMQEMHGLLGHAVGGVPLVAGVMMRLCLATRCLR